MYKIKIERLSFESLQQSVSERIGSTPAQLLFRYLDADGDAVSIANQADLTEALKEISGCLRLICSLKKDDDALPGSLQESQSVQRVFNLRRGWRLLYTVDWRCDALLTLILFDSAPKV